MAKPRGKKAEEEEHYPGGPLDELGTRVLIPPPANASRPVHPLVGTAPAKPEQQETSASCGNVEEEPWADPGLGCIEP